MANDVMAIELTKYSPELKPVVDGLLPVPGSLLHKLTLFLIGKPFGTLDISWMLTNVPIISFHSLVWSKVTQKRVPEDADIRPSATLVWTIQPNNVSSLDADSYLIAHSTLLGKLVAAPSRPMLCNFEISAINSNETVSSSIILEAILPNDLQTKSKASKSRQERSRTTRPMRISIKGKTYDY